MNGKYQDCPITTAGWEEGKQGHAVWHLKNLRGVPFLDFFNSHGACIVMIGKNKTSTLPSSKLTLKFYLREHTVEPQIGGGKSKWMSLCVSVDDREKPTLPLQISVDVHKLNSATMAVSENYLHGDSPITISTKSECLHKVVKSQFLRISHTSIDKYGIESTSKISLEEEYMFGITVTLFHYNGSDAGALKRKGKPPSREVSLAKDLKALYKASENFSDLKIQTKDKMILHTHAFIFAARSPILRALLEKEVNKNDYKGLIKMDDVSGKAMRTILFWMYTGDLEETSGNEMEEVVEAATKYELYDLLKIMDQKLPSICNTENMFRLFQIAKGNCLPTAKAEISKFIKENIDTEN